MTVQLHRVTTHYLGVDMLGQGQTKLGFPNSRRSHDVDVELTSLNPIRNHIMYAEQVLYQVISFAGWLAEAFSALLFEASKDRQLHNQ